ncbi:MAG: BamA/TamA family outer membrane protein [Bacteroidota bacterium]
MHFTLTSRRTNPSLSAKARLCMCLALLLTISPFFTFAQTDSTFKQLKRATSNLEKAPHIQKRLPKRIHKAFLKANDSLQFREIQQDVAADMSSRGYPEFALDTFEIEGKEIRLETHLGRRYFYDSIGVEGLNETWFQKAGFPKLAKKHKPLDWRDFKGRMGYCLNAYQNRGYPFARFDSLEMEYRAGREDSVYAQIGYTFDPGKLVLIDTVIVEGKVREQDYFVRNLIDLHSGDVYDEEKIRNAPRILNSSIYFKNTKPIEVEFERKEGEAEANAAKLKLKLDSRKAGKFDLLLGILPPVDETARLQFTGLIDFQLVSPVFRAGEVIAFRFDKLVGSSQKMHLQYSHPYLFGSPMKVHGEFDLLKQDTTFLTRFARVATYYAFTPNLALKVYYKGKTSSLISTERWEQDSLNTPPVLDGRDQTYGVGFEFENLDYRFSPRKGIKVQVDFGIGRKRIIKNPQLLDEIYDDLDLNIPKREASFHVDYYRPFSKRLVLLLANRTYWLDQPEYFENDLLQVGGSRTIRGFDENQFFTNFYSQFTLENRFLLEQNSYIFVFTDYAYLENQPGIQKILRPWGLGLGLTYETKAGMLSVTYAVGKVADLPFQPSRGRIHVGLINQF